MTRQSQPKALFSIHIKLSDELSVREDVFSSDTPITICDRMIKCNPTELNILSKEHRKMLQNQIELEVNNYIKNLDIEMLKVQKSQV